MHILRYIAISFISGLTAIIPGVSGGTIFAIFGISEHLAEDINGLVENIFNRMPSFKKILTGIIEHGQLPIIIGLGSLFSSLLYAKFLVSYGESIEYLLRFLFIGLVIFSVPTLWNETKVNEEVGKKYHIKYVYVVLGFLVALILFNANEAVIDIDATDYNSASYILKFFLVSLVAGVTAILPGISGTNILIVGGFFEDYILFSSQISSYPVQYGAYLLAAIIGSIIAAKCFTLLFKYFRRGFFSIMTGLTASTIVFIWLLPTTPGQIIQAIAGFGMSYLLIKTLNEQEVKAYNKKNSAN